MALYINTNIASLNAQNNLSQTQMNLQNTMAQLSSGLRINSAKDDAAGLAIATRMQAQINGGNQAIQNSNDAINQAQTTDGALSNVTTALQRMRELAVESANGTLGTGDRSNLDAEFQQLASEITRLGTDTKFNSQAVFGSSSTVYQIGADSGQTITVSAITAASISGDVTSVANANTAIAAIDTALDSVNTQRATLGAVENRFQSVVTSLQTNVQNQTASQSTIMDTDFAAQTANMTKYQILNQAGTAMLAQANSLPNSVLTLLKG
jgi:flagellin